MFNVPQWDVLSNAFVVVLNTKLPHVTSTQLRGGGLHLGAERVTSRDGGYHMYEHFIQQAYLKKAESTVTGD